MAKQVPNDAMNRVLNALRYSVASYLRFARPWVELRAEPFADSLWHVAHSHCEHVRRISELLLERHGFVESRTFPMAYTALNDLSIGYVFPLIIEDEKQIIQLIIASTNILTHDTEAHELMAEVVDQERLHLQMLKLASEARCLTTGEMSIPAKRRMPVRSTGKERLHVRSRAGWITHFPTNVTTEPTLFRQLRHSFDPR